MVKALVDTEASLDALDHMFDCFDTIAIANAFIELSARIEMVNETNEEVGIIHGAMAQHLAHRVRDKRP